MAVEYPIGHRRRREEGIPLLKAKFERNIATRLPPSQCARILHICDDQKRLEQTSVLEFLDAWVD